MANGLSDSEKSALSKAASSTGMSSLAGGGSKSASAAEATGSTGDENIKAQSSALEKSKPSSDYAAARDARRSLGGF